jgi:hypothetical protein
MNKSPRGPKQNQNITKLVDKLLSMLYSLTMPLITDAQRAIKQRLTAACQRVQEIRVEQDKLSPAYERYLVLQRELRQHEKRIDSLAGLIGPEMFADAALGDKTDAIGETVEVGSSLRQLREELPLWEAIREYLVYAEEARIPDIQLFLDSFGIAGSREAIESAFKRHPETFKTRKRGGAKLVSLKGAVRE